MAKGTYVGVNNVARKVKKMYVGVGGVARKVKKGYIGVNGVARLFYAGGTITYLRNFTDTVYSKEAPATNNSYLLFDGSAYSGSYSTYATVISPSLTISKGSLDGVEDRVGISFDEYAIFGSGYTRSGQTWVNARTGYAYDETLTQSTISSFHYGGGSSGGDRTQNYAIIGGGRYYVSESYYTGYFYISDVTAVNKSLTTTNATAFDTSREAEGVSLNNRVLFAAATSKSLKAFTYNDSLTQSEVTSMSKYRYNCMVARAGNYALFAGGSYSGTDHTDIDVYNSSFTRQSNLSLPLSLTYTGNQQTGATLGNHAIFAGGFRCQAVYDFDDSLTMTILQSLTGDSNTSGGAVGIIGNYAVAISTKDIYQLT